MSMTSAPARVTGQTIGRRRAAALPPEARRSMIVDATIPLLIEHGEMVTTRQIATAAGIAEGTIFRAFADKDELVAAALDAVLDPRPLEEALAAIDPSLSLHDVVTQAVAVFQRRQAEVWRVVSGVRSRLVDPATKPLSDSPALTQLLAAHRAELAVTPRRAARALKALVLAMSHPMVAAQPAPASEVADRFLYGVTVRPSC